jgi:uncharacterized membrane-anchored protein
VSARSFTQDRGTLFSKVPEITAYFWIVKVLTTAMGEATSDYLVYHMNPYLAVVLGFLALAVSFALQIATRRYIAWVYWLLVMMVAVFGTMVADASHIVLGIPYAVTSTAFAVVLALVFATWYTVERTLSIHSIHTRRRELFYWATVMATFALGTAVGDMTAVTLHLGYLASAGLFAILFALPLVARRLFGWSEIFTFWFAYVITRPLGASIADFLGMPQYVGGLDINKALFAAILTLFIALFVGYFTMTRSDVQPALQPE